MEYLGFCSTVAAVVLISVQVKYMYLAAQSGFKGQQDFLKYEKARKLKFYVDKIREDYKKKMRSGDIVERQLGTATYLIDFLALRVGGEKDTGELRGREQHDLPVSVRGLILRCVWCCEKIPGVTV